MEGPVSRNITGTWGKNVLKKPTGLRGGRNFFLKKSFHKDMQYIAFAVL